MSRRTPTPLRRTAGVAAGLAAILATAPGAGAATQVIFAAGDQFAPPTVLAGTGDSLTFDNTDLASHNVTSVPAGLFGTKGNVAPGTTGNVWGIGHLKPGQYQFICTLHPGMTGILYVGATGAPSAGGVPLPSPSSGANPDTLLPPVPPAKLTSDNWPFYGRDLANSRDGGASGPSWNEVATMGPVWSFHSTVGDFTGTPVVSDGILVAGAFGGTVFALDASTGRLRWSHNFKQTINASAAIADGRVFVPLAKPNAPALAALRVRDGKLLWQRTIDTQKDADMYGSPVAFARRVYVGVSSEYGETSDPKVATRGAVVALSERTGRQLWKTYTVPPHHDGGGVWSTPAIDTRTQRLYVGTGNAYHAPAAATTDSLLALSARSGRLLAHHQATAGDVWNETSNKTAGPDADFGASPQLITGAGGRQLIGDGQKSGTYWAFDRATLRPVWNTTIGPSANFAGGIVGSTAYDGSRIFGPNTPAGEMWALDRGGKLAWVSSDGGPLHFSPVSVANGVVYSIDMSGLLTARDTSTGVVLARVPIGGPSWGGVAIAGGYVFAVTGIQGSSGYVVAYRPRG
jgi:polyvinyl alcohol dehydrogenase (cytochrome)